MAQTIMDWSEEEDRILVEMCDASIKEIAERLGRTEGGVAGRRKRLRMSQEQRAAIRSRERQQYKKRNHAPVRSNKVPDSILIDRDYRASLEPRDNTAAILGDPPVGYSALERRHAI
jgi:IS30 family transposase